MPRPAKGARLFLRERAGRAAVYVILDTGGYEESTGFGPERHSEAEKCLTRYLSRKHTSAVGTHDPAALPIADLLNFYTGMKEVRSGAPKARVDANEVLLIHASHLLTFFGSKPTTDVRGATCRDYVKWRTHEGPMVAGCPERRSRAVSDQTARRELVVLSAAIGLYHKEYTLDVLPVVTLPVLAPTKRKSLTHSEAAALLAGALGFYRGEDGGLKRRPRSTRTQRKRTARFILIGLYSGTRHSAIVNARWMPCTDGPWIDVDRGILYRRGDEEDETKKRRPPARIPGRLLAHLRRWRAADMAGDDPCTWVIARSGKQLAGRIRKGWAGARADADLGADVVPHVLRHTAGTWLAQGFVPTREAADFVGMTEAMFEQNYYHAHPNYQSGIGNAFEASKKRAGEIRREAK